MTPASTPYSRINLVCPGLRSLQWCGDKLVDWLSGVSLALDGTYVRMAPAASAAFDGAVSAGSYTLVFERLGTEARLLHHGRPLRGLSRDAYCAEAYEYPACLWQTPSGRTLLAHCPERYHQLEIEDVANGFRLTASAAREPEDVFHSRLQTNPSATRLLSAGWVWHPWDLVGYVELARALEDPRALDELENHCRFRGSREENSACWQSDRCVLFGVTADGDDPDEPTTEGHDAAWVRNGIVVYDVCQKRIVSQVELGRAPGTLMPVGDDKVLTLFEQPRLISLSTGQELCAWPDLHSGRQSSSIMWHLERPPPMALDPAHKRFAIAQGDQVSVITLEEA